MLLGTLLTAPETIPAYYSLLILLAVVFCLGAVDEDSAGGCGCLVLLGVALLAWKVCEWLTAIDAWGAIIFWVLIIASVGAVVAGIVAFANQALPEILDAWGDDEIRKGVIITASIFGACVALFLAIAIVVKLASSARESQAFLEKFAVILVGLMILGLLVLLVWVATRGDWNDSAPKSTSEPSSPTKLTLPDRAPNGCKAAIAIKGVICEFVRCNAGAFSRTNRNGEQESVYVAGSFWILSTPVTRELWNAVMGVESRDVAEENARARRPITSVSWKECASFIEKLNRLSFLPSGWTCALPSEEQWEYAGRTTPFHWGTDLTGRANFGRAFPDVDKLDALYGLTTDVKSYPPNAWGIYDMHGNVWEWQQDVFRDQERAIKGGGWGDDAYACRCDYRTGFNQNEGANDIGFRFILVKKY